MRPGILTDAGNNWRGDANDAVPQLRYEQFGKLFPRNPTRG